MAGPLAVAVAVATAAALAVFQLAPAPVTANRSTAATCPPVAAAIVAMIRVQLIAALPASWITSDDRQAIAGPTTLPSGYPHGYLRGMPGGLPG